MTWRHVCPDSRARHGSKTATLIRQQSTHMGQRNRREFKELTGPGGKARSDCTCQIGR